MSGASRHHSKLKNHDDLGTTANKLWLGKLSIQFSNTRREAYPHLYLIAKISAFIKVVRRNYDA